MEIKQICESYFNCFSELKNYENNDAQVTALAVLKLLSFPIVFIPVGFAVVYGFALLAERIKEIVNPSLRVQTVNNIAVEKLGLHDNSGAGAPQEQLPAITTTSATSTTAPEIAYNSNPSILSCPTHYEPYYQKTPKKFTEKIWQSSDYTPKEKALLFEEASKVYYNYVTGSVVSETDWVTDLISVDYLKWLTIKNPTFSSIPLQTNELEDKSLEQEMERKILSVLPVNIDQGPRIYGHPLGVSGGNHRTAFIIDMDNHTIEYFNSFGSDISARKPLEALADALTNKYGIPFHYHHRTQNIDLQNDGYQCGIWTCKLVKERLEQGINFDPRNCKNFDIAQYRKEVYAKAYKIKFFCRVGAYRLESHLKKSFPDSEYPFSLEQLIEVVLPAEQKIDIIYPYVQWGKENKIPPIIGNLFQQALKVWNPG